MWDRRIGHSIRPDGVDGLLLPYQDYLRPTGTPAEDARRAALAGDENLRDPDGHPWDGGQPGELPTKGRDLQVDPLVEAAI